MCLNLLRTDSHPVESSVHLPTRISRPDHRCVTDRASCVTCVSQISRPLSSTAAKPSASPQHRRPAGWQAIQSMDCRSSSVAGYPLIHGPTLEYRHHTPSRLPGCRVEGIMESSSAVPLLRRGGSVRTTFEKPTTAMALSQLSVGFCVRRSGHGDGTHSFVDETSCPFS